MYIPKTLRDRILRHSMLYIPTDPNNFIHTSECSSPSGRTNSSSSGSISLSANVSPDSSHISIQDDSYFPSVNSTTVYVNSLLAVLNTRENLRKRTAGMATIPLSPESIQPSKMNFIRTTSILPSPSEIEAPSISKPQNVGGPIDWDLETLYQR